MAEHVQEQKHTHEHAKPASTPTETVAPAKAPKVHVAKKDVAVTRLANAPISLKHSMYIGAFIKGKTIDQAISELDKVTRLKVIVPFKGETPHRKGPGIMAGRYPVNASKAFIPALKTLRGNCIVNGLNMEQVRITLVNPSWAFRPQRRGGRSAKRTNVIIEAREVKVKEKKQNG